jgi:hypothetical protein
VSQVEPEIKALQDDIFLSKVERARKASVSEKLADGPRLFDQNMRLMRGFIRSQNPDFTEEQVESEVDRRLRIAKKLADRDIYRDAGIIDEQS